MLNKNIIINIMKNKTELYQRICCQCQETFYSNDPNSYICQKCCPPKHQNNKWIKFEQKFKMQFESKFSHDLKLMNEILNLIEKDLFVK